VTDLLSVYLDPVSAWERGDIGDWWPPSLPSGPCNFADCVTTDSQITHTDTVVGVGGNVDVGLVTGGAVGMRRHPMLTAGWDLPGKLRLHVTALAERPAMLDSVRIALRTIRIARK
jgi:hypothetical protein